MATLIIRPKSGAFLKNADLFSKMDPWLRVTLGTESQKTETAYKQGKTPFWKATLSFRLTAQQLAQPDTVVLDIETFDEDGPNSHDYLGGTIFKLSQLTSHHSELFTLQLLDKKNKVAGTVDIEFELQAAAQMKTSSTGFTPFVVKPISGKFLKDVDFLSGMDPWINVTIASESQRTETATNAGKYPKWTTPLNFKLSNQLVSQPDTTLIIFEAFDEDSKTKSNFLGSTTYKLSQVRLGEITTIQLYDKKDKPIGTIDVQFNSKEEGSDEPQYRTQQAVNNSQSQTLGQSRSANENAARNNLINLFRRGDTLVFKPRSGSFLKNADLFSKMDPFVKITFDDETRRTETAVKAGKTPTWKTPVSFPLTKQHSSAPENILVVFEAHDEDSKTKSELLGSATFRLTQLEIGQGNVQTIQLFDNKDKLAGTIDVEYEVQDSNQVAQSKADYTTNLFRNGDTLIFKPKSGKFLINADTFSKMDPLVKVTVDGETLKTETAYKTGKTPTWTTPLPFKLNSQQIYNPDNVSVNIEAYDEDSKTEFEFLGSAAYKLSDLKIVPGEPTTITLYNTKNTSVGTIDIEFEVVDSRFTPETKLRNQVASLLATGDTLIIKPISGQFVNNADLLSKMDPFVIVTVDNETKRNETAIKAGKTPTWNTPLNFSLNRQQISQPENVLITFEAHDEDSKTKSEFLGAVTHKLSQMKIVQGEPITIQLFDKKDKLAGTIDVEFYVQDSRYAPKQLTEDDNKRALQNLFKNGDVLVLKPKSGTFLKNADLLSKMDPFVRVSVDSQSQRTETAVKAGKNPTWKTPLAFQLTDQQIYYPENTLLTFEAYDEDSKTKAEALGRVAYRLTQLSWIPGETKKVQLVDKKDQPVGTIEFDFEIQNSRAKSNTVVIRPKVGTFQKDLDTFSKMDPFVKISYGNESQRTETCLNGGKHPKWNSPIAFKLTDAEINNPESVVFNVEAFDEDSKTSFEFIGSNTLKLSQIRRNEPLRIQLLDKKNYVIGTLDLEVEIQQAERPVIGTIAVKPTTGRFETGVYDSQRFYLVFTHGPVSYQSLVSEGTGRRPVFKDILSFQLFDNEDMIVRCFDNDDNNEDMIAEGVIRPSILAQRGDAHAFTLTLTNNGKRIGELDFEFEFYPDIFNNPVRVYPTLNVRRNEYISKKMKYSNPDRVRKNLIVRSYDNNLVLVKTQRVSVTPNDFTEIRFKIFAPRSSEDKCRVDIIVEETGTVEESLLFKVKSI